MKGDVELIKVLNALLADELSAINQYMVHSEMAANWGYHKLHEYYEKRAIDEMKHDRKTYRQDSLFRRNSYGQPSQGD